MTKKRKIAPRKIAAAVCLILLLLLCGYKVFTFFKEKHDLEIMYEQAYSNARRNILDKYGFDAEFYESEALKNYNPTTAKYGYMQLKAKYKDKEFSVLSDCTKESPVILDSYQYDEIKSALTSKISEELQGGEVIGFSLAERSPWDDSFFGYYGFQTFYDGNNLEKVLENCFGSINMVFADTDFSNVQIADKLQALDIDVELTSFDTEERLKDFRKVYTEAFLDSYISFKQFAPYITDHFEIKDGEKRRLDIKFQSCGDFMYAYFPVENRDFPISCDIPVRENDGKPSVVSQIYSQYGETEYVDKPLTSEFYFDTGYGDIYIYCPLDALKDYDLENIGAAWFSDGGMSNNRNIEKLAVYGDYAVFCLPFGETYCVLVDTSDFDQYIPDYMARN